ncbi:hypothetical protein [Phycicoccus sp. Root101]|uniref:hypothetical protein n=1 Tax=Phycicoccus sp. Root101 TaxID=1736421 RepID=UPI0007024F40|nr:hypothetical protein [Phycicoccus sp. Root101]KQU67572.1 hypothetical protein ASC58_13620 [Phycicoccus sp. Root101]
MPALDPTQMVERDWLHVGRPGKALEDRAIEVEIRTARKVWAVVAAFTLVLLLLSLLRATGVLPLGEVRLAEGESRVPVEDGDSPWPRAMLALLLLQVATQFVLVLLVVEHRYTAGSTRVGARRVVEKPAAKHPSFSSSVRTLRGWVRATPAPPRIKVLRLVLLVLVGAAVGIDWARLSWWHTVVIGAVAEVTAAAAYLLTVRGLADRRRELPGTGGGAPPAGAPPTGTTAVVDTRDAGPLAIGASGGGIRATAFALGGMHALQDHAKELGLDRVEDEPAIFAVSGGSYMGAALALRRRFAGDGSPVPPIPWTQSYRPNSSEIERLRRHTRYLFEPVARWRDGLVSLVLGASVNVIVVGLTLLFATLVSATLAVTVGFVAAHRVSRVVDNTPVVLVDGLQLAPSWGTGQWLGLLSVPIACLVVLVGLTVWDWRGTAVFDDTDPDQPQRDETIATRDKVARWRPLVLGVAAVWLAVVAGLPAALVGVTTLTTSNKPTTLGAAALSGLGFGTRSICEEAASQNIAKAVSKVSLEARISPDEARSVDAGACGYETEVTRTLVTKGDKDPANDVLLKGDDQAARDLAGATRVSVQIGGISGLFLAVIGLLRRGPSPEAAAEANLMARVKRYLLTWLPLAIVGLVAVYLQLLWMFHYLIELKGPFTPTFVAWSALLVAVACLLAYLVDANATSMHGFYRARLADAFCVGIDATTGRAVELPPAQVYRYSDLDGIGLNIVATLNSKAPNEAPTMRGGFPVVFGPQGIRVFREEGTTVTVPMREYEDFAGAGRTSVMASVAISGAAISPLMGRFGIQMAPYRLLLTLFNLRVGTWVRNPLHTHTPVLERPKGWLWLTSKPGLTKIAVEAAGRLSADDRWIYLSDGGHLDNTGLVECVRQHVTSGGDAARRILIFDASNDPPQSWSAVGDAIAVVRADLDIDLQRQMIEDEPPWLRCYRDPRGLEVVVVKSVRVEPPAAGATGVDWNAALPPNVQSFQINNKDFPRAPTARQKFGDLEFEAYRGLGYAATVTSLRMCHWIPGAPRRSTARPRPQPHIAGLP